MMVLNGKRIYTGKELLQMAINVVVLDWDLATETEDALWEINKRVRRDGMFVTARSLGVLQDDSAEDFAIAFMTAFNKIAPGTY